jgi:hypothetical protein
MARLLLCKTSNSDRAFALFHNLPVQRRTTMNTTLTRFDRLMMAITFTESNEQEQALECLSSRKQTSTKSKQAQQNTKITGGQLLPKQTAH